MPARTLGHSPTGDDHHGVAVLRDPGLSACGDRPASRVLSVACVAGLVRRVFPLPGIARSPVPNGWSDASLAMRGGGSTGRLELRDLRRPGRRRATVPFMPALLCLAECTQSPSQDVLGSFFPAWILCSAIGVIVAVSCRVVLGAVRLHKYVLAPTLAYLAIAVAVTLFTWLIRFGH